MATYTHKTTKPGTPGVLIIEDNECLRKVIVRFFRNYCECDITTAADGTDGAEKAHSEKFDVVITDIAMPGMDGNQVAQHISNSEDNHTKILGITGTPDSIDPGLFDAVLYKPFGISTLKETLKNMGCNIFFKKS